MQMPAEPLLLLDQNPDLQLPDGHMEIRNPLRQDGRTQPNTCPHNIRHLYSTMALWLLQPEPMLRSTVV